MTRIKDMTDEEFMTLLDEGLTEEESQQAYDEAEPVLLSEQRIKDIVDFVVGRKDHVPGSKNLGTPIAKGVANDSDLPVVVHGLSHAVDSPQRTDGTTAQ